MYVAERSTEAPRPSHVAIIMDGNGRWAESRGLPRLSGHRRGADRVREIVESCPELDITHLTLFAFSTENWKRPAPEVVGLMRLFRRYIKKEGARLVAEGVRVRFIGGRERLDADLQALMAGLEMQTASNARLHLTVAINYGGRDEILRATRRIAEAVRRRGAEARRHHRRDDRRPSRHRRAARPRPDPQDLRRVPGVGLPALAVGLFRVRLRRDPLAGFHRRALRRPGQRLRPARAPLRRRGGMSDPAPRSIRFADLGPRVASGAAIAAVALGLTAAGLAPAALLAGVALVLMLWEFHAMVTADRRRVAPALAALAIAGAAAVAATATAGAAPGIACLAVGGAVAIALGRGRSAWLAGGLAYMGLAMCGLVVLRAGEAGFSVILWLVLVVVAADIGAYFVGRSVGGRKLWPRVSPGKTWSGALGGLAAAALAGLAFAAAAGWSPARALALSLGVAVASQLGDLLESAVKRRFAVKDASRLDPRARRGDGPARRRAWAAPSSTSSATRSAPASPEPEPACAARSASSARPGRSAAAPWR